MGKLAWVKALSIIFFLIPMLLILLFPFIVMISTSFNRKLFQFFLGNFERVRVLIKANK